MQSLDRIDKNTVKLIEQEWSLLRQKLFKLKKKWLRCGEQVKLLNEAIVSDNQLFETLRTSGLNERASVIMIKIEQFRGLKEAARQLYENKGMEVFHLEVVLYTEPRINSLPNNAIQDAQEREDFEKYLKRRMNNYRPINMSDPDSILLLAGQLGIVIQGDGSIQSLSLPEQEFEQDSSIANETQNMNATDDSQAEFNFDHLNDELSRLMDDSSTDNMDP